MKYGNFNNKIKIDMFTIVNWKTKKCLKLTIDECKKVFQSATEEGLEEKSFLMPLIDEVGSYNNCKGMAYTEPYIISYDEDFDGKHNCMVFFHYGFSWKNISDNDFEFLYSYCLNVLNNEPINKESAIRPIRF